jgi:hypothetical protein
MGEGVIPGEPTGTELARPGKGGGAGEPDVAFVISFFRSPVVLAAEQREIFQRDLPTSWHRDRLRTASLNLRDNVARIFVAARLASRHRAPLLFAEGWRCHAIDHGGRSRHVTGSHMATLILKMLQRRRLADPRIRVLRRNASRCTAEEVESALEVASEVGAPRVVAVAGSACPSRRRVARYLRERGASSAVVYECWRALEQWAPALTWEERELVSALWPSRGERAREALSEGANWLLHWISRSERRLRRAATPLEVRLAHRLRPDAAPPRGARGDP